MFESHLGEALSDLKTKLSQALEVIGGMAESYAKGACPVDTGRLRNSITHEQTGENEETIGSGVEYAPYVELGTTRMQAQPFLTPAAEGHSAEYESVVQSILSQ